MIKIEKFTDSHLAAVQRVSLAPEQMKFAGTADEFIADASAHIHRHVIKLDDAVVGFFKIDIDYPAQFDFCTEDSIGLRAFAIDIKQQGQGTGSASVQALFPYLQAHYSSYTAIYLTVNCQNPAARACYLKGGFTDTGKLYLGGIAGPQYIMQGRIVS